MRKRFSAKRVIREGYLYEKIKDKAEEDFIRYYKDNDDVSMENCINDSIDFYWDEILDDEDYEEIENEDELHHLLFDCIDSDLDEGDIIDNLECGDDYWGLSPRQRNYGFR